MAYNSILYCLVSQRAFSLAKLTAPNHQHNQHPFSVLQVTGFIVMLGKSLQRQRKVEVVNHALLRLLVLQNSAVAQTPARC